jgi:hypothetical protein
VVPRVAAEPAGPELDRLTEQVSHALERRLSAFRERIGRA